MGTVAKVSPSGVFHNSATARACWISHSACDGFWRPPSSPVSPPDSRACSSASEATLGAAATGAVPLTVAASPLVTTDFSILTNGSTGKVDTSPAPAQLPPRDGIHHTHHFRHRQRRPAAGFVEGKNQFKHHLGVHVAPEPVAHQSRPADLALPRLDSRGHNA